MHTKHKVFISYHHANDQRYKDYLVNMAAQYGLFIDRSVDTGDVSDDLDDQRIREIIRDLYLRDSTVTIVLVGAKTKYRKHVDWEIYSSMYDGKVNRKSGVIAIALPSITERSITERCIVVSRGNEEKRLYPFPDTMWKPVPSRTEYERKWPSMPHRIVDNLYNPKARVSITSWASVTDNPGILHALIELAFRDRAECQYDLHRPMRRRNS